MLLIIGYTKTQVLIWDVEAQPNRHAVLGATNSRPDLVHFYCWNVFFFSFIVKRPFPLFKSFLTYHLWQIHPLLSEGKVSLWICIVM